MKSLNFYINKLSSFLESVIFNNIDDMNTNENASDELKCDHPFYILKQPVSLKKWKAVMPYYNHTTMSWDEMNKFIDKMSLELNVKLRLPTSNEWKYAQHVFPILKAQVHEAEIRFWIYNRPYGTIVDDRFPHMRKYELCDGTDNLPDEIFLACGLGHDAIALFLITYDDCTLIKSNDIINANDFYFVS